MSRIVISEFCRGSHVTRPDGARLRSEIEKHWSDPLPVVLDFSGTRIASVSFFDEAIGLLARAFPLDELTARVRVESIDPSDRVLLNGIVTTRAKERGADVEGASA
jgi:hypothetical protein